MARTGQDLADRLMKTEKALAEQMQAAALREEDGGRDMQAPGQPAQR